jgi:hypothetical protein
LEDLKKTRAQFDIKPLSDDSPALAKKTSRAALASIVYLYNESEKNLNAGKSSFPSSHLLLIEARYRS